MPKYSREWVEHPKAIATLVAQAEGEYLLIGGRFVCNEEIDEGPMSMLLTAKGLSLRDFDQCEVVATRIVPVSDTAVSKVIAEMRQIEIESGYRLQSVEAGDVDSGGGCVLASELGYVPWWEEEIGN